MKSNNVNKIILVGNLGQDPELRYTAKGNAVLSLSVATTRAMKDADGNTRKETHWHRATVWGKYAEKCSTFLQKGTRVFLDGELLMKSWTDKDGIQRKSAEIMVDELRGLAGMRPRASVSGMDHSPMAEPALLQ
jgi:single-strand DNA-binding protein